eukprot:m.133556 g.133556  ORF g.133556 m.133556 type:complete len:349 (+) comp15952_c0_seq4:3140-4186(+)
MDVKPDSATTAMAEKDPAMASAELSAKDYYFDSYSHFGIHEEMLKDKVRTLTYRDSIIKNAHLIKDKIVLDVGCGTGILSMFAAQAGAKHVYGIDCSNIAKQARQIVKDNGLSDKVTIIQAKMEDLELPVDKVDVIISEWMGYALLYESMLNTVLDARDKYLVEGGVLLPDKAQIIVSGIEDQQYRDDKLTFWDNVYGFDMSVIRRMAMLEPLVDTVDASQRATDHCTMIEFDMNTVTVADLSWKAPFQIRATRDDYIHALVMHFDIDFARCHKRTVFSTGAHAQYTHWKQTVFYLKEVLTVQTGEVINGTLKCWPNPNNHRDLNFELEVEFNGELSQAKFTQDFHMR